MSILTRLLEKMQNDISKLEVFLAHSENYIKKHNPIMSMYVDFIDGLKNVLTANKKVKIAKYRVNHLRYRLNQMEQLIEENSTALYKKGGHLNRNS